MNEISYAIAAAVLDVSPRQVRRLIKGRKSVHPIRYGYRSVRFYLADIVKLREELRKEAIARGNGHNKRH